MTELSFAKSFLALLDSKPTKLPADHLEDPHSYPARGAYILPKQKHPLAKKQKLAPGAERSVSVILKSLRNPPLDITLSSQSPNTSILHLKEAIQSQTSIPVAKLKVLLNKKPVADSKVLKELTEEGKIEFSVMVIGGAAAVRKGEEEVLPPTSGPEARTMLGGDEFWGDLKGYLVQRLKDEEQGEKVFGVFRKAWDAQK